MSTPERGGRLTMMTFEAMLEFCGLRAEDMPPDALERLRQRWESKPVLAENLTALLKATEDLTDHDREIVLNFGEFIQRMGPPNRPRMQSKP